MLKYFAYCVTFVAVAHCSTILAQEQEEVEVVQIQKITKHTPEHFEHTQAHVGTFCPSCGAPLDPELYEPHYQPFGDPGI